MTPTVISIISLCVAVVGALVAVLTYAAKRKKADEQNGEQKGAVASDIGYIKARVDDIQTETKDFRGELKAIERSISQMDGRISVVEVRVDRLESKQ